MDRRFRTERELNRRTFLQGGFATIGGFLGLSLLPGCGGGTGGGPPPTGLNIGNLGPLGAPDANGVMLPAGFTSRIVARSGFAPVGSSPTLWHAAPDGGACFATGGGGWIYVSNSEIATNGGGAGALRFDSAGVVVDCYPILSGTSRNCAGGKMPWGVWLSCEESGDSGLVYECDPTGVAAAIARPALGSFNHEAAAWEATEGRLYLTEDRTDGRLYRFTPSSFVSPGVPDFVSGALEVAQVTPGPEGAVTWLTVPDPDGSPTLTRLQVAASTPFNGGEGIIARSGIVYFATKGDNRIWSYNVATGALIILYDDSTSPTPILTGVDNVELSSEGDVLVAEDGGDMQIVAITPAGAVVLLLQLAGHSASEITGPAFDPGGRRLYFSSQRGTTGASADGVTFEVSWPPIV